MRAAAASARYEAYPTLAYDADGRLWMAWEESDAAWGKDFGADETTGIGLYHGRWIKTKVWQGERAFTPPDVGVVLPGAQRQKAFGMPSAGIRSRATKAMSGARTVSGSVARTNPVSALRSTPR